ncbi:hypothetical protein THIOKS11630002 [Thiocapsa sp. KS1]|nr:hypothetical protein THIOKS11630002 [Thiocapsa sp. KS1]
MRLIASLLSLSLILEEALIAVHSLSNQPGPDLSRKKFGSAMRCSRKRIMWECPT